MILNLMRLDDKESEQHDTETERKNKQTMVKSHELYV